MADSVVTVRDVFHLPHPGSPEESSARWQSLRQWMNEELPDMKSSDMEDVRARIEELLDIPLSDIFVASWKETDAIRELLAKSETAPQALTNVELADHTIKSLHHPHIEVRRKKKTSKKIEFTLRLLFSLQGFSLRLQNGRIKEIRTGQCEMQGTLEYQGLTVAGHNNAPVTLPAVVVLDDPRKVEVKEPADVSTPAAAAPEILEPKPLEQAAPQPVPELRELERPHLSSLVPPAEITPRIDETVAATKNGDLHVDVAQTEEEEDREVFVL